MEGTDFQTLCHFRTQINAPPLLTLQFSLSHWQLTLTEAPKSTLFTQFVRIQLSFTPYFPFGSLSPPYNRSMPKKEFHAQFQE